MDEYFEGQVYSLSFSELESSSSASLHNDLTGYRDLAIRWSTAADGYQLYLRRRWELGGRPAAVLLQLRRARRRAVRQPDAGDRGAVERQQLERLPRSAARATIPTRAAKTWWGCRPTATPTPARTSRATWAWRTRWLQRGTCMTAPPGST